MQGKEHVRSHLRHNQKSTTEDRINHQIRGNKREIVLIFVGIRLRLLLLL